MYFLLKIVEVSPSTTDELTPGTRLCAYWSQQYRCLYPGSVAEPGTPDPALDSKFVSVEFDDGDSGRIALEDIRLLPPDYPIIGLFLENCSLLLRLRFIGKGLYVIWPRGPRVVVGNLATITFFPLMLNIG